MGLAAVPGWVTFCRKELPPEWETAEPPGCGTSGGLHAGSAAVLELIGPGTVLWEGRYAASQSGASMGKGGLCEQPALQEGHEAGCP